MKNNIILIRYGEIGLKGKNRSLFEKKLENNIDYALKKDKIDFRLRKIRGRILVDTDQIEASISTLKKVFGIVSISPAKKISLEVSKIKEEMINYVKDLKFDTFRVTAQRINKAFELKSPELEKLLGGVIVNKLNKSVSLKEFDINIRIEISDAAYIFTEKIECFWGLPLGVEGSVLGLIEDEASLLACWLCMKRGCSVVPIALEEQDISLLDKYYNDNPLNIVKNLEEAEEAAKNTKSRALVTGQTLKNIGEININLPVLRPLIAFDKGEIEDKLKEIR